MAFSPLVFSFGKMRGLFTALLILDLPKSRLEEMKDGIQPRTRGQEMAYLERSGGKGSA